MRTVARPGNSAGRILLGACGLIFAVTVPLLCQDSGVDRNVPASKAVLEKKLRELGAYGGGRLPILEGFVASSEPSLERYSQGYYQYSVQLNTVDRSDTRIRVVAKITAWYKAADPAHSGYRVLPSNGRLEADLLDRLEQGLDTSSASRIRLDQGAAAAEVLSLPDKPASRAAGDQPNLISSLAFPRRPAPSSSPDNKASDRRVQELREELQSLQDILKNQTQPDDLAAVKASNTPLLATPMDSAQVVLRAEAEDEFQILEIRGDWVHVRISGLSRGWIQRSLLELPVAFAASTHADGNSKSSEPAFRKSREETSTFSGKWEPLQGKRVRIIWVQPLGDPAQDNKATYAKAVFHQTYAELAEHDPDISGVVIIFDSADGGMAAATLQALQQWGAGHLTDNAFWKHCWFDPADAFNLKD